MKPNIFDYTFEDLKAILIQDGFKSFNADQVYNWLYKKHELDLDNWSNVSKALKSYLVENYEFILPKVVWQGLSKDGTRKFLVAMSDENTVETVAIPAPNRLTLCISSQVGCAIGCTFCHTGTMGLTRHLKAHEVVGQYLAVTHWLQQNSESERLTNIVYMGQGEPLHNYENVKKATQIFLDDKGLGLGQRRITLSTSGLVPQIQKLIDFPIGPEPMKPNAHFSEGGSVTLLAFASASGPGSQHEKT